ncbi:Hypothetical protein, putative [Bodo saltans]|uniref:Uncharacterized protein n=1 Tax=Bodo saltans TaxID=75058 RepID=A0A0S4JCG5_BODSA|nr:Hypothetical protein, putative [Bodo saltans]|eukprot:CUG87916.1 Hypothetical protein, putative [Bodo saltans]
MGISLLFPLVVAVNRKSSNDMDDNTPDESNEVEHIIAPPHQVDSAVHDISSSGAGPAEPIEKVSSHSSWIDALANESHAVEEAPLQGEAPLHHPAEATNKEREEEDIIVMQGAGDLTHVSGPLDENVHVTHLEPTVTEEVVTGTTEVTSNETPPPSQPTEGVSEPCLPAETHHAALASPDAVPGTTPDDTEAVEAVTESNNCDDGGALLTKQDTLPAADEGSSPLPSQPSLVEAPSHHNRTTIRRKWNHRDATTSPIRGDRIPKAKVSAPLQSTTTIPSRSSTPTSKAHHNPTSTHSKLSTTLPSLRNVRSTYETQIATMERVVQARSGGGGGGSSFLSAMFKFAQGKSTNLDLSDGFLQWVPIDDFRLGLELVANRPSPISMVDVSGWCTQEQGQLLLAFLQLHRTIVFVKCNNVMATGMSTTLAQPGRGANARSIGEAMPLASPVSEEGGGDFNSVGSSPLTTGRLMAKAADPHLAQQRAPVQRELVWKIAEACVLNVEYCAKFERVTLQRETRAMKRFFAAQLDDLIRALESEESGHRFEIGEERRKFLLKLSAVEHMQLVSAHRATKRREQEIDFEGMRQDVRDAEAYARWLNDRRESAAHIHLVSTSFQHLRRSLVASTEVAERFALVTECNDSRYAIRRREGIRRQANREAVAALVAALSLEEFGDRRDTAVLEAQFRAHLSGCLRDLNTVALEFQGARSALDDEDNRVRRVETDKIEKERHAFKEHVRHEDGRMHLERIRERERFFQKFHQSNGSLEREEVSEFRMIRELRMLLLQAARAMAAASSAEAKLAAYCVDDCGLKLQVDGRTHLHSYAVVSVSNAASPADPSNNKELLLPWVGYLRNPEAKLRKVLGLRSCAYRFDQLLQALSRRKAQTLLEETDTKVLFEGGADRCAFAVQHDVRPPLSLEADVTPPIQSFLSQRRIVRGATVEFKLHNSAIQTLQPSALLLVSPRGSNVHSHHSGGGSFAGTSPSGSESEHHHHQQQQQNNNNSPHHSSVPRKAKLRTAALSVMQADTTVLHPSFEESISCVGFERVGCVGTIMGITWERVAAPPKSQASYGSLVRHAGKSWGSPGNEWRPHQHTTPPLSTGITTTMLCCSALQVTDDAVMQYSELHHKTFCSSVSTLLNLLCFRRVLQLDGLDAATALAKTISAGRPPVSSITVRVTVVGDGIPDSALDVSRGLKLKSSLPLVKRSYCASSERVLHMEVRPPLLASALPMSRPIQLVKEHGCGAVLGKIRKQVFPSDLTSPMVGSPKSTKRLSNAAIVDMFASGVNTPKNSHQGNHSFASSSPGGDDNNNAYQNNAVVPQFKLPATHNDCVLTLRLIPESIEAQLQMSLVLRLDPGVLSLDPYSQGAGALLRGKSITLSPCPKFFVLAPSTSEAAFRFPSPAEATRVLEIDLGNDNVTTGDLVAFLQQCVTVSPVDGCTLAHGLAARIRCEIEDPSDVVSVFEVPFTTAEPSPVSPVMANIAAPIIDDTPFGFVSPDPRRPLIIHPGPDPSLVGMPNTPDIHHAVRLMPRLSVLLARAINMNDYRALLHAETNDVDRAAADDVAHPHPQQHLNPLEKWVINTIAAVIESQSQLPPQSQSHHGARLTPLFPRSADTTPPATGAAAALTSPTTASPLISGAMILLSPIGDIRVHGTVDSGAMILLSPIGDIRVHGSIHVRPVPEEREVSSSHSNNGEDHNGSGSMALEWVEDPHDGRFVVFAPRHKGIGFARRPSQVQKNKAFDVVSTGAVFTMSVSGCTLRELAFELQEIYVSTTHFMLRPRVASLTVSMDLVMKPPAGGDADTLLHNEVSDDEHEASTTTAVPPALQTDSSAAPSRAPSRGNSVLGSAPAKPILPIRSPPPAKPLDGGGEDHHEQSGEHKHHLTQKPPSPLEHKLHAAAPQVAPLPKAVVVPWLPFRTRVVLPIEVCEAQLPIAPVRKRIQVVENAGGWVAASPFQFTKPDAAVWCDAFNGGSLTVNIADGKGPEDNLVIRSMSVGPIRVRLISVARLPRERAESPNAKAHKEKATDIPSPASADASAQSTAAGAVPSPSAPGGGTGVVVPPLPVAAAAATASSAGKTTLVTTPRRKGPMRPGKVDDAMIESILSPNTTDLMSALSHRRGGRLSTERLEDEIGDVLFDIPLQQLHHHSVFFGDAAPIIGGLPSVHSRPNLPLGKKVSNTTSPTTAALHPQPKRTPTELRLTDLMAQHEEEEHKILSPRRYPLMHFTKLEDVVLRGGRLNHQPPSVASPLRDHDGPIALDTNIVSSVVTPVSGREDDDEDMNAKLLMMKVRSFKAAWLVRDHIRQQISFGRGQEILSYRRTALLPTMVRTYEVYRDTTISETATTKEAQEVALGASGAFGRLSRTATSMSDPFGGLGDGDVDGGVFGAVNETWKKLGTMTVRKSHVKVDFVEANQDAAPVSSDDVLALLGNVAFACEPCTTLTNNTKLLEYNVVPADGPEIRFSQIIGVQKAESHPTVQLLRTRVYYVPNTIDVMCIGALPVTPYAQCFVQAHPAQHASAPLCFDGGRLQYEIISGEQDGDNLYLMTRDEQLKAKNLYEIWRQEQVHLRNRDEPLAPQVEELLHKFTAYEGIGEVSATGKMMRTFVHNRQRGDDVNFSIGMTEAYNPLKVLVELGPWQPDHCQALHVMTAMNAVGFRTTAGPGDRVVRISLIRGGSGAPLMTHVRFTISVRSPQLYIAEGQGRMSYAAKRFLRAPATIVSVFPTSALTVDLGPDLTRVVRQGYLEFRMVGVETGERLCFRCPTAATDSVAPVAAAPPASDAAGKKKVGAKSAPVPHNPAASTTSSTIGPAHTTTTGDVGNTSFHNTSVTSILFGGSTLGSGGALTTPMAASSTTLPPPFCLYGRRLFDADGTTYLGVVTVAAPTLIKIEFDFSSQCTAQHIAHLVKCLHMAVGRGVPPGVSPSRRVEVLLCTSESYGTPTSSTGDGFTSFLSSVVALDSPEGAAPTTEDAA